MTYIAEGNWTWPVIQKYWKDFRDDYEKNSKNENEDNLFGAMKKPDMLTYTVNLDFLSDPAPKCEEGKKNFMATYQCGLNTAPIKQATIDAPALGKIATFDCSKETAQCKNIKLVLNDDGSLLLQTTDGSKTLWSSVKDASHPIIAVKTAVPVETATIKNNNVPLIMADYAGDGKPHPNVDVVGYSLPGRRYRHNYLLPGNLLARGQWIGSPTGTCRLIMGTPENPNALQVVMTILGCNSLDDAASGKAKTDLGCWKNTWDRSLSTPPDLSNYTVETCGEYARENGAPTFGLQNGKCILNKAGDGYKKRGAATGSCPELGSQWVSHVYKTPTSDPNAVRIYTTPDMYNSSKGKVGYIDYLGQLNLYPDSMTAYINSFENIGSYKMTEGARLGQPVAATNVAACQKSCETKGDTQQCAGFVFDSTAARCQLLNSTSYTQNAARIIDKNSTHQYYARTKNVKGQDISCPAAATPQNTLFWNGLTKSTDPLTNPMSAASKCGLAKYTEKERAAVASSLPSVYNNLEYKDETGKVLPIEYLEATTNPRVAKTGFKYWYESLQYKYARMKKKLFNTNTNIDKKFNELQDSRKSLADWTGEQLQNLTAMNEDRDLNMMSQNYRHIMWSILAILIIIVTIKLTKSGSGKSSGTGTSTGTGTGTSTGTGAA